MDTKKFYEGFDTCVISGGSSGLGHVFLRQLYELNPRLGVINLSRRPAVNPGFEFFRNIRADFSSTESMHSAACEAKERIRFCGRGGRMLLINNAGIGEYSEFCDGDVSDIQDIMSVNVMGPVILTKILCPDIVMRKGAVLNVCSMAAFQPTPFMSTYGASKAFLLNWSISLEAELAPKGCIVRALCPGPCATNFFTNAGYSPSILPDSITLENKDVVKCGLELLLKSKPYAIAGAKNRMLNYMSRAVPLRLSGRLAHMSMLFMRNKKKAAEVEKRLPEEGLHVHN